MAKKSTNSDQNFAIFKKNKKYPTQNAILNTKKPQPKDVLAIGTTTTKPAAKYVVPKKLPKGVTPSAKYVGPSVKTPRGVASKSKPAVRTVKPNEPIVKGRKKPATTGTKKKPTLNDYLKQGKRPPVKIKPGLKRPSDADVIIKGYNDPATIKKMKKK